MRVITNHPVITEENPFSPENEYWNQIDGTNDLQVRHFQVWANSKKQSDLKINGRLDKKTKNAYAAFGPEWEKVYKQAYPNLSTTNPQGQKVKGKLWDSTKKAWVTARDTGLLQKGLDALGIDYTLPTAPPSDDLSAGPSRSDAAVDAVDDLESELKKDKNKKFIKTALITTAIAVIGYLALKKFKVIK
jgi:hypothetical protein